MSLIAYPIATDAPDVLTRLKAGTLARAVREKEAEMTADARVAFVTEPAGPVFETKDAALAAYAGLLNDDNRFCQLVCRPREVKRLASKPLKPIFKDGERWPKKEPVATVWQLSVSYWKILTIAQIRAAGLPPVGQARHLRKKSTGKDLTPEEIIALSQSPLLAARPQKALDFGLFDFPLPENPGIIIADE
jgi:hypothetical protein